MKTKTSIVLPKLPFPRKIVHCSAVRQQQARAVAASQSMQASLHAKYLFILVSGKKGVLPGKVSRYWEAMQQVLAVLAAKS